MEKFNIKDFNKGWFVGNFDPIAFKTDACEVCYKLHKQGENWPAHYHKITTEINYLINGIMSINGERFKQGDIFIINPGEIANPVFHTDCELIVVRVPGIQGDKYEV